MALNQSRHETNHVNHSVAPAEGSNIYTGSVAPAQTGQTHIQQTTLSVWSMFSNSGPAVVAPSLASDINVGPTFGKYKNQSRVACTSHEPLSRCTDNGKRQMMNTLVAGPLLPFSTLKYFLSGAGPNWNPAGKSDITPMLGPVSLSLWLRNERGPRGELGRQYITADTTSIHHASSPTGGAE